MNQRFLESITEGYVVDNDLTGKVSSKELSKFLLTSVQELREEDPELYEELSEMSTKNKIGVFNNILEMELELTSTDLDVFEEGAIADFFAATIGDLAEGSSSIIFAALGHLATALKFIGGNYLIFTLLFILIALKKGKPITKAVLGTLKNLAETVLWFSKKLKSGASAVKYRYSIIYQNEKRCYEKYNLKPDDISAFAHFAVKAGKGGWIPEQAFTQALNLRHCYMNSLIEKIALFMTFYFDCLRKTGDASFNRIPDDKIMSIIMGSSISSSCSEYHKHAKILLNTFNEVLEHLYKNAPRERAAYQQQLNLSLIDAKGEFELKNKPNRSFNQQKKPQYNPNFKRK